MAKCLLLLLTINVFCLFSSAEISRFVCQTEGGTTVDVKNPSNYNVLALDKLIKWTHSRSCSWEISKPNLGSHLNLISAVLDPDDILTITGSRIKFPWVFLEGAKATFFQTNGSFSQKGLVYLEGYDIIRVSLWLQGSDDFVYDEMNKTSDPRSFYAVYHNSVVELPPSTGELTFFRNTDTNPIINGEIVFQPKEGFADQLMLLNFTQLPVNASSKVTVDGVQLNTSALPAVFLQSPSAANITVTVDMPQAEPITVHYLLVNKQCSESAVLKMGNQARSILYLNETERLKLVSTPVHCAMLYTAELGNQFAVHLPSPTGVADYADSLYFYNKKGQVVLKIEEEDLNEEEEKANSTAGNMKMSVLGETDTVVIIYKSPYVISPNADFQAPEILVFPDQDQNGFEKNTISKIMTTGNKSHNVRPKSAFITINGGSSIFYTVNSSESVVTLSSSTGQATVLFSRDWQNQMAQTSLQFTPKEINDQLIMLNFTQLPVHSKNTKVTVDGVQLNSTSQTMFLQSPSSPVITVILNMTGGQQKVKPITLRWWLVNKQCSEKTVLRVGDQRTAAFGSHAEVFKVRSQPVRCAMHLSTEADARFGVYFFNLGGVADPADSVHFYDARGQAVVPAQQRKSWLYYNDGTVLIDTNTAVILYESLYSSLQYADFSPPKVWAISKQDSLSDIY